MGHGRGTGLLYHAEYPERFWQRLSKGRLSDDWQRHQMSSLTFTGEEPSLFSGLYHVCIMFASCVASAHGGGESLICVSYIGILWEPGRRLWQLLRSCSGEYRTAYRGLVRVGRASGGVWLAVARWMGGSEVEDGRLPSWEGMGWSEKLSRLVSGWPSAAAAHVALPDISIKSPSSSDTDKPTGTPTRTRRPWPYRTALVLPPPECRQDLPPAKRPGRTSIAAASSHLGEHRSPHTAHLTSNTHSDGDCGIAGTYDISALFTKGLKDKKNGGCC
jgi:hypothetical protein